MLHEVTMSQLLRTRIFGLSKDFLVIKHITLTNKRSNMAKTREQKEQAVSDLTQAFSTTKLAVLTDYRGLDVPSISQLRANLRDSGIPYTVAKNSLVKLALAESGKNVEDTSVLVGPVAIAFGPDEVEAARIVYEYTKQNDALEILGAIDEQGNVLGKDEVVALAKLPSRDQLLGQVVGTIAAPLSGFVRVLNGNVSGLVYALQAVADKKAQANS
jgi:large subunit ribosomal protein L10